MYSLPRRASIKGQLVALNKNKGLPAESAPLGFQSSTATAEGAAAMGAIKGAKGSRSGCWSGMSHMPSMRDREALAR